MTTQPRVVLVTGVSRHLGGRFVRALAEGGRVERVIGIDVVPPSHSLGGAEFIRADIRNPVIAKVIARDEVDTVVHMGVISTPQSAGGRSSMKEINVIGTMQLLAACQKAPAVRKLVVKSSASVYGCSPRDPAMFAEDMEPKVLPRSGYAKDSVEVEGYVRGFARRRPDVAVTTIRFANVIGPVIRTDLTRYFSLPIVPTPLGYDPRLQFIHEDDALDLLTQVCLGEHPGTFNAAGPGVITLAQAIRRAGRVPLPLPAVAGGLLAQVVRRAGVADFSGEQQRFLTWGRGLDVSRVREEVGFEPKFTTLGAFDDFVRGQLAPVLDPDLVTRVERAVAALGSARATGDADA